MPNKTKMTMDNALGGLQKLPELRVRQVIRLSPGFDYGLVLSERVDSPGVLGLGAIDRDGDGTALGLNEQEVRELRDALDAWLQQTETARYPASAPDPWLDADAAAAHQPPPF